MACTLLELRVRRLDRFFLSIENHPSSTEVVIQYLSEACLLIINCVQNKLTLLVSICTG